MLCQGLVEDISQIVSAIWWLDLVAVKVRLHYTEREAMKSDAKQPKTDITDNSRNVKNRSQTSRAVAELHLDKTAVSGGLFWASDLSDHSWRLATFALHPE